MTKLKQIIYSIILIIIGWVLNAIAWTIAGPHPINTIFLISGVLGLIAGAIWLMTVLFKK